MLRDALTTFEWLGTPRWADRARAELEGAAAGSPAPAGSQVGLTAAEQRVAKLAASGLTNREVAATLFISTKTVEANLARAYRKLGIESRAELGQRIGGAAAY
jgi:DNA-binding CsgD family transcriptional regulator